MLVRIVRGPLETKEKAWWGTLAQGGSQMTLESEQNQTARGAVGTSTCGSDTEMYNFSVSFRKGFQPQSMNS